MLKMPKPVLFLSRLLKCPIVAHMRTSTGVGMSLRGKSAVVKNALQDFNDIQTGSGSNTFQLSLINRLVLHAYVNGPLKSKASQRFQRADSEN